MAQIPDLTDLSVGQVEAIHYLQSQIRPTMIAEWILTGLSKDGYLRSWGLIESSTTIAFEMGDIRHSTTK
jgi:hypothetical protein